MSQFHLYEIPRKDYSIKTEVDRWSLGSGKNPEWGETAELRMGRYPGGGGGNVLELARDGGGTV